MKNKFSGILRVLFLKFLISISVMLFTSALWDWGLTWGAVFFAPFVEFLDFMLSAMMDKAPLSIGSGVGPSNRPLLDLNLPPAPEPEPALPSELSEEEIANMLREQFYQLVDEKLARVEELTKIVQDLPPESQ
jgi:hypothetical protein